MEKNQTPSLRGVAPKADDEAIRESDNKEKWIASPSARNDEIKETGGPKGPDPTRYGDWEIKGKCVDF
jgi:hypothetical protein